MTIIGDTPFLNGWYYLSCRSFTVAVQIEDSFIIKAPPRVWKFRGQRIENLVRWMVKQGEFKMKSLGEDTPVWD